VSFAESAEVGLFLFSTAAVLPTSASVSAFCCKCAREKSPADIDRAQVQVEFARGADEEDS